MEESSKFQICKVRIQFLLIIKLENRLGLK